MLSRHFSYVKYILRISIVDPVPIPTDPCIPSPCGPNSQCRNVNDNPSCSCLRNYVGPPPNCRPECVANADCPSNLACINEKCRDPCPGSCGVKAICEVRNHNAICTCPTGYSGDSFVSCYLKPKPSKLYKEIWMGSG